MVSISWPSLASSSLDPDRVSSDSPRPESGVAVAARETDEGLGLKLVRVRCLGV